MAADAAAPNVHVATDAAPMYKVAYDEAVRGLTTQAGVLDNVRTRAGLLITAANVVTAFLAPQAITNGSGFHAGALVAIGAFILCLVAAISILWSRGSWRFATDANIIIKRIEGDTAPNIGDLHRWIAVNAEKAWASNQKTINGMFTAFKWGCVLLGLEVLAWIAVLAKVNIQGMQL
jgi:hypothetical protein